MAQAAQAGITVDQFVANTMGKELSNAAGTDPGECVSLVSQYLLQVYGINNTGWNANAIDYQSGGNGGNHLAANGFSWSTNQSFANGDILVWGQNAAAETGPLGHVGIWYGGKVYDQNDGRHSPYWVAGYSTFWTGGYLGHWRKGTIPPPPAGGQWIASAVVIGNAPGSSPTGSQSWTPVTFTVTTGPWTVNVRGGPGTNYSIVRTLPGSTAVTCYGWEDGQAVNDAWYGTPDQRWYRIDNPAPRPDTTPPTTTVSGTDANWHKTAVTVTLAASDTGGSGVKASYYTIDGTQHTYTAPFIISSQGSHAVTYWSVDKAGNTEIAKTCTVKIDTTRPTTTVSGTDVNWHKTPVTVTLTASDAGGSGVKATYYTIDGTQHTYAAPFAISSQGSNTVTYWSVDNADNTEIAKSATVNIDTTGPVTAAKAAKGKAGHALKLSYQISDNLSPTATGVKLVVKNSDGKVVKTLACGTQSVTVWHTASWTPKAKGTYSYAVYAKDLAGNVQSTAGSAKIRVK